MALPPKAEEYSNGYMRYPARLRGSDKETSTKQKQKQLDESMKEGGKLPEQEKKKKQKPDCGKFLNGTTTRSSETDGKKLGRSNDPLTTEPRGSLHQYGRKLR